MAKFNWNARTLDVVKQEKLAELDLKCSATIVDTFPFTYSDGVEYYFYCDTIAQSNFEKVDRAFDKGRITQINWTAYDSSGNAVRLLFTAETFDPLYVAHLNHIQGAIAHFRDVLQPQVEQADTITAVEAVTW